MSASSSRWLIWGSGYCNALPAVGEPLFGLSSRLGWLDHGGGAGCPTGPPTIAAAASATATAAACSTSPRLPLFKTRQPLLLNASRVHCQRAVTLIKRPAGSSTTAFTAARRSVSDSRSAERLNFVSGLNLSANWMQLGEIDDDHSDQLDRRPIGAVPDPVLSAQSRPPSTQTLQHQLQQAPFPPSLPSNSRTTIAIGASHALLWVQSTASSSAPPSDGPGASADQLLAYGLNTHGQCTGFPTRSLSAGGNLQADFQPENGVCLAEPLIELSRGGKATVGGAELPPATQLRPLAIGCGDEFSAILLGDSRLAASTAHGWNNAQQDSAADWNALRLLRLGRCSYSRAQTGLLANGSRLMDAERCDTQQTQWVSAMPAAADHRLLMSLPNRLSVAAQTPTPFSVLGRSSPAQLSCGWGHIALLLNGYLLTSGENYHSQCARGKSTDCTRSLNFAAFSVSELEQEQTVESASATAGRLPAAADSPNGQILQVSCGATHTLALDSQGVVYFCGSGRDGKHGGAGARPDSEEDRLFLQPVPLPEPIAQVAAGADHSLAVSRSTGQLYAWGFGQHGAVLPGDFRVTHRPRLVELHRLDPIDVEQPATRWRVLRVLEVQAGNDISVARVLVEPR